MMRTYCKPKNLSDFSGPTKESGSQVVYQYCPVCGSSRFKVYVNPETGYWFCHDPAHSGGGRVDVGLSLSGRGRKLLDGRHNPGREEWPEVPMPPWEPLCRRAAAYLQKRGMTARQVASLGLVEMKDSMRVIFPYYGPTGQIIYWNARSYSKLEEGPKYLAASGRHPLYVRPNWTPTETVVVVEGVFDAIAVEAHAGLHAVALGGKFLPSYLMADLLRLSTECLVLILDNDALTDAIKLRSRLQTKRQVKIIPLPPGMDPADMGEKLKGLL